MNWGDCRGRGLPLTSKGGVCLSFAFLLLVITSGCTAAYTLRVKESGEGRELAAIQVRRGEQLKVEYVHSMYKVKQSEVFSIGRDSRFYLEKVTFGSYAAALYYEAEPSQGFAFEGGLWMAEGGGKNYSLLKYRASPSTGHILHIGNQRLNLCANSQSPGRLIEICLEKERRN